jgi:dUTPase
VEVQHASILLHVGEVAWRLEETGARRCVLALEDAVEIEPGELVAIVTDERIQLPGFVSGTIFPKGRMPLLGLATASTTIDPGFNGYLFVTVANLGTRGVRLPRGLAIAKVQLERLPSTAARLYGPGEDAKTSLPRDDYLFIGAHSSKRSFSHQDVLRLDLRISRMEQANDARKRRLRVVAMTLTLCLLVVAAAVLPKPLGRSFGALAAGQSGDLFQGVTVGILLAAVAGVSKGIHRRRQAIMNWLGCWFGRAPANAVHPDDEGETDAGDRQGAGAPG